MPVRSVPKNRAFAIVFAALMTMAAGGNALVTVLPAIGREIGVSDTLIASVFALSALFWTVSSPFWAEQSDRRGRKALIMLGLSGFVVSMFLFGLVVLAGLHHLAPPLAIFAGMAVARSLHGLIGAAGAPAAQAYVADRTGRAERTNALALLASAFGLGTVVGPALAPFFVLPGVGLAGPPFAFAIMAAVVLVVVWRGLPSGDAPRTLGGERPTRAAAPKMGVWRDPRVQPFLIYALLVGSAQAVNTQVLGFHVLDALHMPPAQAQSFIGLAMLAGAAAALIAQWGLIRMMRLSARDLLRWGAGLALVGNVMTALAPSYFAVVIGFCVLSLGYGFARPGFTAGASLAVGPREQGAVAGAVTAVSGACWLVAPIAGVALYEWVEDTPFLANIAVLAAMLAYAVIHRGLRSAGASPAPETITPDPKA